MKDPLNSVPPLSNSRSTQVPLATTLLHQGIFLTKRSTLAALPMLTFLFMLQPAQAWEKNATLEKSDQSVQSPTKLSIDPKTIHKIQKGDTLWELSRQYDISPQEIAKHNDLNPESVLQVGEILTIPKGDHLKATQPQLVELSAGGIGGAAPQENSIIVEPLSETDPVTAVPNLIAQNFTSSQNSEKELTSELPVQDFLADIKELRTQYQQKRSENEEPESLNFDQENQNLDKMVFSSTESSEDKQEIDADSLASAPIKIEFYNHFLNLPIGETVSPELPALSSPDQYLPEPGEEFDGYIWPAEGVFTSGYGQRWGRMHRGIDIAGPIGTPILAAAPGEVIFAGWNNGGFGKLVKLKHPDETVTLYAHNNRILVQKGQEVDQGEQIAEMGTTGRSTGPHLHFEIHPHEQGAVDPLAHLPSGEQVQRGQKITDEKMNSNYTSRR
nr:peptidoglycan DD-metalloendopeptidase family protein [Euhalothece natronophila]